MKRKSFTMRMRRLRWSSESPRFLLGSQGSSSVALSRAGAPGKLQRAVERKAWTNKVLSVAWCFIGTKKVGEEISVNRTSLLWVKSYYFAYNWDIVQNHDLWPDCSILHARVVNSVVSRHLISCLSTSLWPKGKYVKFLLTIKMESVYQIWRLPVWIAPHQESLEASWC